MNTPLNVNLDLETLSTRADAVILQIAASVIKDGKTLTFSTHVSQASQPERHVDDDTVEWWQRQGAAVRERVIGPTLGDDAPTLREALCAFTGWYLDLAAPAQPWGNGPSFDLALMNHAYHQCDMSPPWHYRVERCLRTLIALAEVAGINVKWDADERVGDLHDAESDAAYQAARCDRLWNELIGRLTCHVEEG